MNSSQLSLWQSQGKAGCGQKAGIRERERSEGLCGGGKENGPKGKGTIRRCGLAGAGVSLWGWALRLHICSSHTQCLSSLPVASQLLLQHYVCLHATMSHHNANERNL